MAAVAGVGTEGYRMSADTQLVALVLSAVLGCFSGLMLWVSR